MNKEEFIKKVENIENYFSSFMKNNGYHIYIDNDRGYSGTAVKDDPFALIFKLYCWEYPRSYNIFIEDRNGNFAIDGSTVAIYSLNEKENTYEDDLLNSFHQMLNDVYDKYKDFSKENRLDFVFNGLEVDRKDYKVENKLKTIREYGITDENKSIIEKVENYLKQDEDYMDYANDLKVDYIIQDPKNEKNSYAVVELVPGDLAKVDLDNLKVTQIPDWDFTMDTWIFENLENGMELGYMSLDVHYGVWQEIFNYYPDDIEHKDGVKKYLKYCEEHNINLDLLNKNVSGNLDEDIFDFVKSKDNELDI